MNARDELRGTLSNTVCNASNYTKRAQPYLLGSDMSAVLDTTSEALLAAGYRKLRTITTVEELDALPVGSAVGDSSGFFYEKYADFTEPEYPWWATTGDQRQYPARRIALPATVLYEPEATA